MKKFYIAYAIAFMMIASTLHAQPFVGTGYHHQGKVVEGLSMPSELGNRNINFSIYLPPDYEISNRSYPVVYLLHGYSDNETAWVQFGQVNETVDRGIASREIPPMIIVMPDAGVSFYVNQYDGSNPFEDIMIKELIPHIDKNYRTRTTREFRAVSGLSMGGYGSLILAIKNPDLFSSCAAFSSAIFTDEEIMALPEDQYTGFIKKIYGPGTPNTRLNDYLQQHSVINLVNTLPLDQLNSVKFYIDNGDDDFLFEGNAMLHIAMRKRGVNHQFRVRDGAHNWTYWRNNIYDGLKFIGEGFSR